MKNYMIWKSKIKEIAYLCYSHGLNYFYYFKKYLLIKKIIFSCYRASLLIEGFKRFEGRFWNHSYRGPLWIHAGATPPTEETIAAVEN